jgi:capsid assembly protease
MRNPALFSRIFNVPLMIQPSKLDAIIAGISGRWDIKVSPPLPTPEAAMTFKGKYQGNNYFANGNVAVIPIVGILAHRGGVDANSSYVLGYNHIQQAITQALNDEEIESILLEVDSPGGEVAGAFELAALIKEAGKTKPIKAVISSMAASAGYLIASAASEISLYDTGIAGSIGVVLRHIDMSKAAEMDGISVTYVYAGDRKVDGNPFEPLPKAVKADLQSRIDKLYGLFVTTVANNRGLSADAVRSQQAQVYTGQDAIFAGLADRIATPDEILAEMQQGVLKPAPRPTAIAATANQAEQDGAGWAKAFADATNPPQVGIAPLSVPGRTKPVCRPPIQAANPSKDEIDSGWKKATAAANAQLSRFK